MYKIWRPVFITEFCAELNFVVKSWLLKFFSVDLLNFFHVFGHCSAENLKNILKTWQLVLIFYEDSKNIPTCRILWSLKFGRRQWMLQFNKVLTGVRCEGDLMYKIWRHIFITEFCAELNFVVKSWFLKFFSVDLLNFFTFLVTVQRRIWKTFWKHDS